MIKPKKLKPGDRIAIVSLSSGILGEDACRHQLELGIRRLESFGLIPVFMENALKGIDYLDKHPEARARDLMDAFSDDSIKGIIAAIGGDDTYRLLPYLLSDADFIENVRSSPKIFTGFSDSTNNHLMFHKLGMTSYYGPNFLSDLAELDQEMLPYTQKAFELFFRNDPNRIIRPSPVWYEERTDFSKSALHTTRRTHVEKKGHVRLHGSGIVTGALLGGCLESLYDAYTGARDQKQKELYERFHLLPTLDEWKTHILFLETSEERPTPVIFDTYLRALEERGILKTVKGLIFGKPQDEHHQDAYMDILKAYAVKYDLPVLCNVNFGHAYPRTVIPYGLDMSIDFDEKRLMINEPMFA